MLIIMFSCEKWGSKGIVFRTEIIRLMCRIHLRGVIQVMSSCVFLVSKYSCYASLQTCWSMSCCWGIVGDTKAYLWQGMRVEKEEQPALLQLLSHLPSFSDGNVAFLLASEGRAEVELLPKPLSGPLCTKICTINLSKPWTFRVFGLHVVMLLFLAKMFYCIKYLKKSCVNIVDPIEHLHILLSWVLFHMYLI